MVLLWIGNKMMHKSAHKDTVNPPGQVVYHMEVPLERAIEAYQDENRDGVRGEVPDTPKTPPMVPLYKVEGKTYIRVNGEIFLFHHIDGMYSYCLDENDHVVHLGASTPVEIIGKTKGG